MHVPIDVCQVAIAALIRSRRWLLTDGVFGKRTSQSLTVRTSPDLDGTANRETTIVKEIYVVSRWHSVCISLVCETEELLFLYLE